MISYFRGTQSSTILVPQATWVYVPDGLYPSRPAGTFCWLKARPLELKGSTCDNGKAGCVSGVVNRTMP